LAHKAKQTSQVPARIMHSQEKGKKHFKVRLGPIESHDDAIEIQQKLAAANLPNAVIVTD